MEEIIKEIKEKYEEKYNCTLELQQIEGQKVVLYDLSLNLDINPQTVLCMYNLINIRKVNDYAFQNWFSSISSDAQKNIKKNNLLKSVYRFWSNLFLNDDYFRCHSCLNRPIDTVIGGNDVTPTFLVLLGSVNVRLFSHNVITEVVKSLPDLLENIIKKEDVYIFGGYNEIRMHKDLDIVVKIKCNYTVHEKILLSAEINNTIYRFKKINVDIFIFKKVEFDKLEKKGFFKNLRLIS